MEKLRLGQITNVVGLNGEIKVYPYTDYKEKFEEIEYVLIKDKKYFIEHVRYNKNMVILKLDGIDNRNTAENYKESELFIDQKDVPPLPENTYYVKDLIGLCVIDEDGKELGKVKNVILNQAQDLYEIELNEGKNTFLVPAVDEFISEIDLEAGIIRIHLIEGLIEL